MCSSQLRSTLNQREAARLEDRPLRLASTDAWSRAPVHVWDIIAELIASNVTPAPHNPLAVDRERIAALLPTERVLAAAATAAALRDVVLAAGSSSVPLVLQDMLWAIETHYTCLPLALLAAQRSDSPQTDAIDSS